MSYDFRLTPVQVQALGRWVEIGPLFADVELVVNGDHELEVTQGDDYASWAPEGTLLCGGDDPAIAEQQHD